MKFKLADGSALEYYCNGSFFGLAVSIGFLISGYFREIEPAVQLDRLSNLTIFTILFVVTRLLLYIRDNKEVV